MQKPPTTIQTAAERSETERRAMQQTIIRAMNRLATRLLKQREIQPGPRDALHIL